MRVSLYHGQKVKVCALVEREGCDLSHVGPGGTPWVITSRYMACVSRRYGIGSS